MPGIAPSALQELEVIEADDALHDFGGSHGNKGHDFASFWVIFRLIELEAQEPLDYAFVCEYMQDVAEFDSSTKPTRVQLYQLKKKEDGYWSPSTLTGQTGKSKNPKVDKPVWKLLNHVRQIKVAKASGTFVSNGKFEVPLANGESSVNDTRIGLHQWDAAHTAGLQSAIAQAEGIKPEDVDLSVVELRSEAIAINDLQRHANGVVLEFLAKVSPDHAGQASSLVDTLYVRIRERSRRTEKCASWGELLRKRGFTRGSFRDAVRALSHLPNKVSARLDLLHKLSTGWRNATKMKVETALTRYAAEKVMSGESGRWRAKEALKVLFETADQQEWPDQKRFEAACSQLVESRPELTPHDIQALAIYEMTEWDLSQIPA